MMAHRVFRTRRDDGRQVDTIGFVTGADIGRWGPGRVGTFIRDTGYHGGSQGISAQLTNTNRIHGHRIFTWVIIVQTQLGKINHNPFARGIR
ncbi:hypothetical protein D3C73_1525310 [compost metagenome]